MKYISWLVLGIVLVGCIIPPSEAVIQTAIAETKVATSGEPPEQLDLRELIEEAATLPEGFMLDEAEDEIPGRYIWKVKVDDYAGYTLQHGSNRSGG